MTLDLLVRRGRATAGLALAALALSAGVALAATAGDLDPSFDQDGRVVLPFKITPGQVLPQADGKVLVTDEDSATVVRLNNDGTLDRGFGGDGIVSAVLDAPLSAAALQADGKLVVAASPTAGGITVARLDTDGSLDETFGPGGPDGDGKRTYTDLQPYYADALIVQPDGRIAVVGAGSPGITVSRLMPEGEPDGTVFGYADMSYLSGAALAPDGKLVVTGYTGTSGTTDYDLVAARFKGDGPLDSALGGTGRVQFGPKDRNDVPVAVVVQPDRKIVIAEESGTAQPRMTVMRLTEAGALDTTFAGDGTATPEFLGASYVAGAALQPDGKIVVAGTLGSEQDFIAARFDAGGEPDRSFGADGKAQVSFDDISLAYAAALQPDGRLVIAGLTVAENETVIRTALARVLGDQPLTQPEPQPGTGGGEQSSGGGAQTPPPAPRCAGKPATIVGSPGADRLRGTSKADVIVALGGDDRVRALGRGDVVCGGAGRDRLEGGAGADRLLGGAGRDVLIGGAGRDRLDGGAGRDRCLGGPGRDRSRSC